MIDHSQAIERWFNAYRIKIAENQKQSTGNFYFVESSAPINVDDKAHNAEESLSLGKGEATLTKAESAAKVFEEIAKQLADKIKAKNPANLVILVHGFNNPRKTLLKTLFSGAYSAMSEQDATLICYRWPSEGLFATWATMAKAAPWSLRVFFLLGPLFIALGLYIFPATTSLWVGGLILFGSTLTAFYLRLIVYYRDQYRAAHYAAPDLVELVRELDKQFSESGVEDESRVNLSFVAHSMGGYVVTNAIRTLSDIFTPQSMAERGIIDNGPTPEALSKIGHAFKLSRLILVSPDIPAEVLISSRANVLASSLKRFEESYLFSNEGDEVLRLVSTIANYFAFPTQSRIHGYRLGNVRVIPANCDTAITADNMDQHIQVGYRTLHELQEKLEQDDFPKDAGFTAKLSYFDCTYFKDDSESTTNKVTLTGGCAISNKPIGLGHILIALGYVLSFVTKIDVHSGYFKAPFLRNLIFSLASQGYTQTRLAFSADDIEVMCRQKQVKVLLKPELPNQ